MTIKKTLVTLPSLLRDLQELGVKPGHTLICHSSLSSLGWVCGGPVAVIQALEQCLGAEGTLIMPTHSSDLSNPAHWQNPPVPKLWWDVIRKTMPAFDRDLTPSLCMGAIPECFRKQREVLRSYHPQVSFAAWGKHARAITENHSLNHSLGDQSPLGRARELDAMVLLLGVDHNRNTSLHLAEYKATWPSKSFQKMAAPIENNGERVWTEYTDLDVDSDDFQALGTAFDATGASTIGKVGEATCKLFSQREILAFAIPWLEKNRT
ncbi:MAG: AAC(3) family N-acetyltransferase [Planctomycetota bacterium]|nr:AAC(3) family N-acetyltransferase [Planctomycetota bacterium]